MRRVLPQLTVAAMATILAVALHAAAAPQGTAQPKITITGLPPNQAGGVQISVGNTDLTSTTPLGSTNAQGILVYSPNVAQYLSGKTLNVRSYSCQGPSPSYQVQIWSGPPANATVPNNCSQKDDKAAGAWGRDITIPVTPVAASGSTASDNSGSFATSPVGLGLEVGVPAAVIAAVLANRSSTTTTNNNGGGKTPVAFTTFVGTYAITESGTNTCGISTPATAGLTIGGTQSAATITTNFGSFSINGTMTFTENSAGTGFTGTGNLTGASPTAGTISGSATITLTEGSSPTANAITGSYSFSGACGGTASITGSGG